MVSGGTIGGFRKPSDRQQRLSLYDAITPYLARGSYYT